MSAAAAAAGLLVVLPHHHSCVRPKSMAAMDARAAKCTMVGQLLLAEGPALSAPLPPLRLVVVVLQPAPSLHVRCYSIHA